MKKLALIGMLIFGLATPAMADVDLAVVIDKNVAIQWDQNLAVDVAVALDLQPPEMDVVQAAVADAFLNQRIEGNLGDAGLSLDAIPDEDKYQKYLNGEFDFADVQSADAMLDSLNGNSGIVGANQASGSLNNQGNTVAVSVVTGSAEVDVIEEAALNPPPVDPEQDERVALPVTFVKGIGAVDQKNLDNDLLTIDTSSSALIEGSVNDNAGIVGYNQSPGNFNNQGNAVAIAAGLEGVDVAMAEADLGQLHTGIVLGQFNYVNTGTISGSISGNDGIVQVNQSAGNMNHQGNVVSIAAVKGFND